MAFPHLNTVNYSVSIENHLDSSMKAFTGKVVLAFTQEEASVVVVGQRESGNTKRKP
jgi:hypothetical protein